MPFNPQTFNLAKQQDCGQHLDDALLEAAEGRRLRVFGPQKDIIGLFLRLQKYVKAYTAQVDERYDHLTITQPVTFEDGRAELFIFPSIMRRDDVQSEGVE